MLFLIWLIWRLHSASSEIFLMIPFSAIFIRCLVLREKPRFSLSFLFLSFFMFITIIGLHFISANLFGFEVGSLSHISPFFISPSYWFAFRISCSALIILILLTSFQKEFSDPYGMPELGRYLIYFGTRSFPVIRAFGEETHYTHALIQKYEEEKSFIKKIQLSLNSLFSFVERLCAYVNDMAMLIDIRGGLPPIRFWRKRPSSKFHILYDLTLIISFEIILFFISNHFISSTL